MDGEEIRVFHNDDQVVDESRVRAEASASALTTGGGGLVAELHALTAHAAYRGL